MADQELKPLHAPRSPGDPVEIKFVRDQAEFYNAMANDPLWRLTHVLMPACWTCGSDNLWRDHHQCCYVCVDCGKRTDDIHLRAGRIAKR